MSEIEEIDDLLGDDLLERSIDEDNAENLEANEQNEEGEEQVKKTVEIKKRNVRAPLPKLNAQRLSGPRGVHTIEKHFENFKFAGKHHEKEDLNKIMTRLELWAHRLFPKYQFDDCLERIERLGKQRVVMSYMNMYRLNTLQLDTNETIALDNVNNYEDEDLAAPLDEMDEFLNEQIALAKTRDTFSKDAAFDSLIASPASSKFGMSPKPSSTPIPTAIPNDKFSGLTEEQKNLIAMNRKKAQERLLQKQRASSAMSLSQDNPEIMEA